MTPRVKFRKGQVQRLHGQRVQHRRVTPGPFRQHQFEHDDGCISTLTDEDVGTLRRKGLLRDETADEKRNVPSDRPGADRLAAAWATATSAEQGAAMFKYHFVEAYNAAGAPSRSDANLRRIAAVAWDGRPRGDHTTTLPGARTVRGWIARFDCSGLEGLLPQLRLSGNFNAKIPLATELLTAELVEEFYCSSQRLSAIAVHECVEDRFRKHNRSLPEEDRLPLPSYRTVLRAVGELCPFVMTYMRQGKQAAAQKFRLVTGGNVTVRHNERWEVDHTRLNVMARLTPNGPVIGRPWITVVLDCHTRMVVGFWVGFEAPSVEVTCRALRMAILPKDAIMARYGRGLRNPWPCRSLASLVCTDQGSDFKAGDLRARLGLLGISSLFTPVLKPWYRARIERFFKTIQGRLSHTLPGTVFGNIFERDAEMLEASPGPLTLDDLWRLAMRYIVDVYHVRCHRGLERSPLEAYRLSLEENDEVPELPESQVDQALSWCGQRRLNEQGIRVRGIFYRSEVTAAVFMRHGGPVTVPVYRSPEDLTSLSFRDPDDGLWYDVPVAGHQFDSVSGVTEEEQLVRRRLFLAELDLVKQEARAKADADDEGNAYGGFQDEVADTARTRGHVGRTLDDAERAKAKTLRTNEALMAASRPRTGASGDGLASPDLNDLFGLGLPPPPVPEPDFAAGAPVAARRTRKAEVRAEPMGPVPVPAAVDGEDDDLAEYARRNRLR